MARKDFKLMNREEKIFLVQCLLADICENWRECFSVEGPVALATFLCDEIGGEEFSTLASKCTEFLAMDPVDRDGCCFQTEFPYGYENMDKLHNLSHTLADKSDEFKSMADFYIIYPEHRFEDMKERERE